MKKLITLTYVLLILLVHVATLKSNTISTEPVEVLVKEHCIEVETLSPLISAMILVESSNNNSAHNKKEHSVGCLQIRPIMVREVNRLLKRRGSSKRFKLKDRWNRQKSIEMFLVYTHTIHTLEAKARMWNGGPNGMNKTTTIKYWRKVTRHFSS